MRPATLLLVFGVLVLSALGAHAQSEPEIVPIPASTMAELMSKVIYPISDPLIYAGSRPPTNEVEWNELQGQALMLAETANLLLMPERALDQDQWLKDTKLMLDAGIAAFEAAMAKDVDALAELNEPLYQCCVVCHLHYRPNYLEDAKLKLENPPE